MIDYRIDHIGVAVADLDTAIEEYTTLLGYCLLRGPYDDPAQQARVAFIGTACGTDSPLELVAPLDENSQVHRVLAKGMGLYHVCYQVTDIEEAIADLRSKRCLVISGPTPAVAYEGRPIAWLYTPQRQLMELVESE